MEPTQQNLPLDPFSSQQHPEQHPPPDSSSSQQQPDQHPPPVLPLPSQHLPHPLAIQHLLAPISRPSSSQQQPEQHPPLSLLRPHERLPPPSSPLLPPLSQGPQHLDAARLYLSMPPQPQFFGHIPGVGATIPSSASTFPIADQMDPRLWSSAPAIGLQLTPQERRALWDVCHLVPGDVGSADSSACLVRLLQEAGEDVRAKVFNGVMGALQLVMRSSKWHVVFVELLRERRSYELQRIVDAACEDRVSLTFVASSEHGVASLKSLFRAVKLRPGLRQDIVNCLLNQGLFQQSQVLGRSESIKVLDLLRSFFTTFPGEDCRVVIRHALDTWRDGAISSTFQSLFLVECFVAARYPERQDFEEIVLNRTNELAMGRHSNIFLDKVLQCGHYQLKEEIATRLLGNLVNLSLHEFGTFVVQACFLRTGGRRLHLLRRVLTGFLDLHDGQLAQLMPDRIAYCLFGKLLGVGKSDWPEETKALALRIQKLEVAGDIACLVKELAMKVLAES